MQVGTSRSAWVRYLVCVIISTETAVRYASESCDEYINYTQLYQKSFRVVIHLLTDIYVWVNSSVASAYQSLGDNWWRIRAYRIWCEYFFSIHALVFGYDWWSLKRLFEYTQMSMRQQTYCIVYTAFYLMSANIRLKQTWYFDCLDVTWAPNSRSYTMQWCFGCTTWLRKLS